MDMRIPPLKIKIMLESNPLKSRIVVRRLAVLAPSAHGTERRVDHLARAAGVSALDCAARSYASGVFRRQGVGPFCRQLRCAAPLSFRPRIAEGSRRKKGSAGLAEDLDLRRAPPVRPRERSELSGGAT